MSLLYEGVRRCMELLYGICGDYGAAIVLFTVVVRLCMLPLNQKQRQAVKSGQNVSGCLLSFLQFPIMLILYNGIRLAAAVDVTTVLLPWIPSLLVRDSTCILPVITVFVQILPQLVPYIGWLKSLHPEKMSIPMIIVMLFMNSCFAFVIPAGVELYYMVSGLFTAAEQTIGYIAELKKLKAA